MVEISVLDELFLPETWDNEHAQKKNRSGFEF
jgi:hypothetical protein